MNRQLPTNTKDEGEYLVTYDHSGSVNMPGWETFAMNQATEGGLRNFAIVKYNLEAYVSTCIVWLLPNKEELLHIYKVLKELATGCIITISSLNYRVSKNDGRMLEAWLTGRPLDVLCIGRSKQYLTLGVQTDLNKTGHCFEVVSWVRDTLSKQGK